MMMSATPLVADQLIDCVATGRAPTTGEISSLAERMWKECARDRSAFAWGELEPLAVDRMLAIRAAQMALCGSGEG